jgi:hypothetical protein
MEKNINLKGYDCVVVHAYTRKGQNFLNNYNYQRNSRNRKTRLSQCYGRYSVWKDQAWCYCEKMCKELEGTNLVITSYNGWAFSVAFTIPKWNVIMYITKDYNYCILL